MVVDVDDASVGCYYHCIFVAEILLCEADKAWICARYWGQTSWTSSNQGNMFPFVSILKNLKDFDIIIYSVLSTKNRIMFPITKTMVSVLSSLIKLIWLIREWYAFEWMLFYTLTLFDNLHLIVFGFSSKSGESESEWLPKNLR